MTLFSLKTCFHKTKGVAVVLDAGTQSLIFDVMLTITLKMTRSKILPKWDVLIKG